MGYRSEVAIKVYGDDDGMLAFKQAYDKAVAQLSPEEQDYIKDLMASSIHNGFDENVFAFHVDGIKWYPEYASVKFFIELLTAIVPAGLSGEFIRIGEEYDDIETEYFGDDCAYELSVTRSIEGFESYGI